MPLNELPRWWHMCFWAQAVVTQSHVSALFIKYQRMCLLLVDVIFPLLISWSSITTFKSLCSEGFDLSWSHSSVVLQVSVVLKGELSTQQVFLNQYLAAFILSSALISIAWHYHLHQGSHRTSVVEVHTDITVLAHAFANRWTPIKL